MLTQHDTPTIAEVSCSPLPARDERGEGCGEGLVPSNCRALLKSPLPDPLPTSSSWGEGISRGLGGGIKTRPADRGHAKINCVVLGSVRNVSGHARVHGHPARAANDPASVGP